MEGVKIYGLCLERLRHQIRNARKRTLGGTSYDSNKILLEAYNTGEIDDIIDILELYDVEDRTRKNVQDKLDELAFTVSEFIREKVIFGYTDEGHLGLYVALPEAAIQSLPQEAVTALA